MSIQFRNYTNESGFTEDFQAVRKFLIRVNEKKPIQYDFLWGRWEWAFSLPGFSGGCEPDFPSGLFIQQVMSSEAVVGLSDGYGFRASVVECGRPLPLFVAGPPCHFLSIIHVTPRSP